MPADVGPSVSVDAPADMPADVEWILSLTGAHCTPSPRDVGPSVLWEWLLPQLGGAHRQQQDSCRELPTFTRQQQQCSSWTCTLHGGVFRSWTRTCVRHVQGLGASGSGIAAPVAAVGVAGGVDNKRGLGKQVRQQSGSCNDMRRCRAGVNVFFSSNCI